MSPQAATVEGGTTFLQPGGQWATERLLKTMQEGKPLNAAALRTNDTLRKDEWRQIDDAVVEETQIRLRGVANLFNAGLTIGVPNALGKTVFQWEDMSDMQPAVVSLDGLARADDDRVEYAINSLPLPIIHKDFNLGIRTLEASRTRGEALDTTQGRVSSRLVSEQIESLLYNGYSNTFLGSNIYGLLTHPNRNTDTFGGAGAWSTAGAATGEDILTDVQAGMEALEAAGFYGPYWLDVPTGVGIYLSKDFKANSDKTTRQRLLEIDELERITVCDQLPADNIVMYQPTLDVVAMLDGEPVQTVQWDQYGGFKVAFKVMAIQIPLVRATQSGDSGVWHLS
jgi:uncharacterized linocin/CFP29 family protein